MHSLLCHFQWQLSITFYVIFVSRFWFFSFFNFSHLFLMRWILRIFSRTRICWLNDCSIIMLFHFILYLCFARISIFIILKLMIHLNRFVFWYKKFSTLYSPCFIIHDVFHRVYVECIIHYLFLYCIFYVMLEIFLKFSKFHKVNSVLISSNIIFFFFFLFFHQVFKYEKEILQQDFQTLIEKVLCYEISCCWLSFSLQFIYSSFIDFFFNFISHFYHQINRDWFYFIRK